MSAIFVTGATGFLGTFLVAELLRQTDADLFCLVRCRTSADGRTRLHARLAEHQLLDESAAQRLHVVRGDLGLPRFGLTETDFAALADRVDAVYHSGALVNFAYPYGSLKDANVLGTHEALRLAGLGRRRPFHHLSTLRVFYGYQGDLAGVIYEDDVPDSKGLRTGYSQTKWVAEQLVRTAESRGIPVTIYRPGMITGHSETGVSNPDDLFSRMVGGCVQMGTMTELNIGLDLTPVDYCAKSIVYLSLQPSSVGRAFHIVNPAPLAWGQIVEWIRALGYPVKTIAYDRWLAELHETVRQEPDNALAPLIPFFRPEMGDEGIPLFDCRQALHGLAGSGISCPPISEELLATYCRFFVQCGLLDRSPVAAVRVYQ
ncbi:MAG TPA: thioester reductase domain-containing protein [Vicinamibacterales bacterium]